MKDRFLIQLRFIIILSFILLLFFILFYCIPNINLAKNTITNMDLKYYEILSKKNLPDYEGIIKNGEFLKQIISRDKVIKLWGSKLDSKLPEVCMGNAFKKSFLIFDYCIIESNFSSTVSFETLPEIGKFKYKRLTLLKKYNGNWFIVNDIISKSKPRIQELFELKGIQDKTGSFELMYTKLLNNNY